MVVLQQFLMFLLAHTFFELGLQGIDLIVEGTISLDKFFHGLFFFFPVGIDGICQIPIEDT